MLNRRSKTPPTPIAVAMYLPEQYPRLVATAEDAHDLEATWQQWHQTAKETMQKMAMLGMHLIEVTVDLDDLEIYCLQQGHPNTSSTRANYAAYLLTEARQQAQPPSNVQAKKKKRRKH